MTIKDYFNVFVLVLVLVLIGGILWLWRDKDNAQSALIAAQATVGVQAAQIKDDNAAIKNLTNYKFANDKLTALFVEKMSGIDTAFGALNLSISKLRRSDAAVEKYLSEPIPPALLCLLGGVCAVQKAGTVTAAAPAQ